MHAQCAGDPRHVFSSASEALGRKESAAMEKEAEPRQGPATQFWFHQSGKEGWGGGERAHKETQAEGQGAACGRGPRAENLDGPRLGCDDKVSQTAAGRPFILPPFSLASYRLSSPCPSPSPSSKKQYAARRGRLGERTAAGGAGICLDRAVTRSWTCAVPPRRGFSALSFVLRRAARSEPRERPYWKWRARALACGRVPARRI